MRIPSVSDTPHGLATDLPQRLQRALPRRHWLGWLAGSALLPAGLTACGGGHSSEAGASGTDSGVSLGASVSTDTASSGSCSVIASETAGPYPGDGSNSNSAGVANALLLSGIVRADIRSSVGNASGTAAGVPLTLTLTLVDAASSCTPLAGHAVYLWHCTREGGYSMYSRGLTGENYLRGVQVSDAQGQVRFTTVFPGCYSGRWPHIHFEVFASLEAATSGANDLKTSQLAMPAAACAAVYGVATGYDSSLSNFNAMTLASDNVFGNDSAAGQLASVTGDMDQGFAASLQVGIGSA